MMQSSRALSSHTPSFNSYSSSRLTDIAARVVKELQAESLDEYNDEYGGSLSETGSDCRVVENDENSQEKAKEDDDDDDEEFEFAVVGRDFDSSPTPADEIFYNGQIRPYFPLFNTDLVFGRVEAEHVNENLSSEETYRGPGGPPSKGTRLSLRKLFIEDREHGSSSSCSSSEAADDLDGVQPDSYCVWTPKLAAEERRKKSNSTASSKRWRLRDLRRSISNGRESFVLFTRSSHQNGDAKNKEEKLVKTEKSSAVAPEIPIPTTAASLGKDGDRQRMTFLPYRRDLVGFTSNFNGLRKNLHTL